MHLSCRKRSASDFQEVTLKRDSYLDYSATVNAYRYSASTPVSQTRTTLRSVATVPARKISILSPAEGSSASAVIDQNPSPSRPVRDTCTCMYGFRGPSVNRFEIFFSKIVKLDEEEC